MVQCLEPALQAGFTPSVSFSPGVDHRAARKGSLCCLVPDDEMITAQGQHRFVDYNLAIPALFRLELFFRPENNDFAQSLCRAEMEADALMIFQSSFSCGPYFQVGIEPI